MGIRAGAVAGTATFFTLAMPALASACEPPPQADLGSVSGRAGETVSFELPATPRGATYAVMIEGAPAGSGTDGDDPPGTQATLTIPDLGAAAREAQALVAVECEDGGWERSLAVKYAGRPAAATGSGAPAASPPPGAVTRSATPSPRSPARPRATTPAPEASDGDGAVKGVREGFFASGPALLDVTKTGERIRRADRRAKQHSKRRKRRRAHHLRREGNLARPAPPEVGGGGADLSGGDIGLHGPSVAWPLLVAVAAAGLLALLAVVRRTRRRRLLVR